MSILFTWTMNMQMCFSIMEILTKEYLNKYIMSKGFDWQKQFWEALFYMQ